jgi:hypothetical protein
MNKLTSTVLLAIVGLVALADAGPTLTRLIGALVPFVLVIGVIVAVLRWVWWYTR